jgi:hypothetical protein
MKSFVRRVLGRSLVAGVASLAFMMASAAVVRAQTVIGADGQPGDDCFTDGCHAGNGDDGQPASSDGNSATAVGGNGGVGGIAYSAGGTDGLGGNGGGATATSSVLSNGSSKAVSTATATGGNSGHGAQITGDANGGNASATSHATANGSGDAASFATANGGGTADLSGDNGSAFASSIAIAKGSGSASAFAIATILGLNNGAVASSYAETGEGGLAQAESQSSEFGGIFIESNATAKTAYGGVSVQSTFDTGPGSAEAIAQGGSGQFPASSEPFSASSTALPNTAYATALIGSAGNVADALLGPSDKIFGSTILGRAAVGAGTLPSSTFDFSFRGDLILGVIDGVLFDVVANGTEIPFETASDNSVIDLGFLGPNIDLTIAGEGVFVLGGAVPETSTWAMILLGFAGLGFTGYRRASEPRAA